MVDPVGPKPSIERRAAVAPAAPLRMVQTPAQLIVERAAPSTLQALAKPLSAEPPVDAERVSRIKKAIQDGHFPLVPSTIADRLLALKLQWKPHEKA